MADPFLPKAPADIVRLIQQFPLAWVVSRDFQAAPLPLLAETDDQGSLVSLLGHMGRTNPLYASLSADPSALILFSGPAAYVTPRHMTDRNWGPTWNYAVVRVEAEISFVPDETDAAVAKLVAHMEAGHPEGWSVDELGDRFAGLARRIIAFRAAVSNISPKFKLGQDEKPRVFAEIVQGLHGEPIAAWMRAQQGAKD